MSVFPASLDSDATLYVARDFVTTTLSANQAIGDTVLVVANGSRWAVNMVASVGTVAQFQAGNGVGVEEELVTGVAGNVLTVTRAFGGTTAVAHAAGAIVANNVDAIYQSSAKSALIAIETAIGANLSNVRPSPVLSAASYNFAPQTPGGSLIVGSNTITLTPVPLGVNGSDVGHYLKISGGTGTTEGALITGGTAVSGAPTGTVIVVCANTHSGAWTIQSANGGIVEAITALGPTVATYAGGTNTGGGSVFVPPATYTVYGGPILVPSNVEVYGVLASSILSPGTVGMNIMQTVPRSLYNRVHDLTFNLQGISANALVVMSSQLGRYADLEFQGGNGVTGVDLYLTVSGAADVTYNCILNDFQNIHIEIGTVTPVVLRGSPSGPSGAVTENTFRNLWVAGGGVGQSLITIDGMADSNYWYNVNFESGLALIGFDIGPTSGPGDAGGQYIDYVVATGPDSGSTIIKIGPAQNNISINRIVNLGWTTPFFVNATALNVVIENYRYPTNGYGIWAAGGVHIGETQNPTSFAIPSLGITLVNGANSGIAIGAASFALILGPTGAFSVGGFVGGTDGRILYLFNMVAFAMTIKNEDTGSAASARIATLTGADVTLRAGISFATFIYSSVNSRWLLVSTN